MTTDTSRSFTRILNKTFKLESFFPKSKKAALAFSSRENIFSLSPLIDRTMAKQNQKTRKASKRRNLGQAHFEEEDNNDQVTSDDFQKEKQEV